MKFFKPKLGLKAPKAEPTATKAKAPARDSVDFVAPPAAPESPKPKLEPKLETVTEQELLEQQKQQQEQQQERMQQQQEQQQQQPGPAALVEAATSEPAAAAVTTRGASRAAHEAKVSPKPINVDLDDDGDNADTELSDREDEEAKSSSCGLFQPRRPAHKSSAARRSSARCSLKNMQMRDLIYWYPKDQPPPKWRQEPQQAEEEKKVDKEEEGEKEKEKEESRKRSRAADGVDGEQPAAKSSRKEAEAAGDEAAPAPQVMLDSQGNIVLNEESLVIREARSEPLEDVREDTGELKATYHSFRESRPHRGKQWGYKETVRFYKALSTIGTDFSYMVSLFRHRTREELKRKYKREEKAHPHLIDRVLKRRKPYDMSIFDPSSESEAENPVPELQSNKNNNKNNNNNSKLQQQQQQQEKQRQQQQLRPSDILVEGVVRAYMKEAGAGAGAGAVAVAGGGNKSGPLGAGLQHTIDTYSTDNRRYARQQQQPHQPLCVRTQTKIVHISPG